MADQTFYGYFETPVQDLPDFDQAPSAPCPYCGKPITAADVRTHSVIRVRKDAQRAYFYRTHRSCDDMAPAASRMDDFILQMIEPIWPIF